MKNRLSTTINKLSNLVKTKKEPMDNDEQLQPSYTAAVSALEQIRYNSSTQASLIDTLISDGIVDLRKRRN